MPAWKRIGVRALKNSLAAVLDEVAAGERVLLCRRAKPLAALIPVRDLERLHELTRRDDELAAVLRGRGHLVDPWATPGILEVIVSYLNPRTRSTPQPPDSSEEVAGWS